MIDKLADFLFFFFQIVMAVVIAVLLFGIYNTNAQSTLATLQANIDAVPAYSELQDRSHWSDQQKGVAKIIDQINKQEANKKPRTDMIRDFGRNGIDVIQEYR